MTKPKTKTKAIRMPGTVRPAASRLGIQGPPTAEPHLRNTGRDTKPSDSLPIGPTAEGLAGFELITYGRFKVITEEMRETAQRDPPLLRSI